MFATMLTVASAGGVMWLAVRMLALPAFWSIVTVAVCISICVGLSGLAIGLGARFPVIGQRNPARIAAGFGGTFNLIASMLFVVVEIGGVAILSLVPTSPDSTLAVPDSLTPEGWFLLAGLLALGGVVAAGALAVGAQHFGRMEG
jgi:ABC-2 type transport system permease protein